MTYTSERVGGGQGARSVYTLVATERRSRSSREDFSQIPSSPYSEYVVDAQKDSSELYDAVDLRLIDTFPASDAVARY